MITDARVNAMLDTEFVTGDLMSLHTAFSATGASEVTGGTYTRQSITFAAASARAKAISASLSFTLLPASVTIAFLGIWNSAGTTFKGMWPNGGTERSYQVDLANNRIYCEGHGMIDTDRVVFTGTTLGGPAAGTSYFVVGTTAGDPDYFQVSTTSGGAALDLTGQPSGDASVSKQVLEPYVGAGGQHDVNTFSIAG